MGLRRTAIVTGILAVRGVVPAYAEPIHEYAVDGICSFRVHSTATGAGNEVHLAVAGVALPSAQPGVPTSTIRCELIDGKRAVVFDQTQTSVGASALAETVEVTNAGPYVMCVTAKAVWNTGQAVTEPRNCTS